MFVAAVGYKQVKSLCFWNSNQVWGPGSESGTLMLHSASMRADAPVLVITNHNSELFRRLSIPERNCPLLPSYFKPEFLNPVKILTMARVLRQHRVR